MTDEKKYVVLRPSTNVVGPNENRFRAADAKAAPKNYTVAHEGYDIAGPTERRFRSLDAKVNRATRPEDIWTDETQLLGVDPWHCDLAPAVAAERWAKVQELSDACDSLEARWNELETEAEEIRKGAAKAHADAMRKGVKAPATAAKAFEADAQLEGCSLVLREAVTDIRRARAAYDSLTKDRAFLSKYRKAVIAEFNAQRKRAVEAFNTASGAIGETRRRYAVLHELTMGGLLDIPKEAEGHLGFAGKGWLQADLSSAMNLVSQQVNETDPFLSGEFLTAPMDDINATAIEAAAEYAMAEAERSDRRHRPADGIISTRLL
ncbi:hypothetical protein [Streptomyces sp. NPDC088131]|uniref:hypothetical protein n=1 Tax=Streptomyces sp. NPDC088131 TaxID=3365826 RepID=UPI00380F5891